jgi:hypothetical protein
MQNHIVKKQFNRQAEKFANWSVGKNVGNDFFETFDKLVDISHHRTLSTNDFGKLYQDNKIEKTGEFRIEVDLHVNEYLEHAKQNKENRIKIQKLLEDGKNDCRILDYLYLKDDALYFKRPVYLIIGKK